MIKKRLMRKILALSAVFALAAGAIAPALTSAQTVKDITTGLTRSTVGGANPVVKAKWEMNATKDANGKYLEGDDSTAAGAQFLPSGKFEVGKNITMCAVVTDPDGLADINAVYADVFYPKGIALGPSEKDRGCGDLKQEDKLTQLSKADGIELFCNKVRNNNNNLPTFNAGFNYDDICKADGQLMKETSAVYCGDKILSYEDPAGDFRVLVDAQDKNGLDGTLENTFTYLPLTAFETDFSAVNYGNVKLNTHKIINGDLTFTPANSTTPTVRNTGNTRLSMRVLEDDMGLGKTDNLWNVRYDGRVGSDAVFTNYDPNVLTTLVNPLNLSETDEMDFSIDVFKFPPTHVGNTFTGALTLSAISAPHLTNCEVTASPSPSPSLSPSPTPTPGQ